MVTIYSGGVAIHLILDCWLVVFSSPGRSLGRAVVLSSGSAFVLELAAASALVKC